MAKAISNKNVAEAKFNPAPFEGAFKAALGRPELKGSWLIFGNSGVGKTTFALQLAKYLTNFVDKVAFDSLEQGLSLSLQKTWNRVGMEAVGAKVILLDKEGIPELRARLAKRKSPNVVIIDSVMCLIGLRMSDYQKLVNDYPNKLFVFSRMRTTRANLRPPSPRKSASCPTSRCTSKGIGFSRRRGSRTGTKARAARTS